MSNPSIAQIQQDLAEVKGSVREIMRRLGIHTDEISSIHESIGDITDQLAARRPGRRPNPLGPHEIAILDYMKQYPGMIFNGTTIRLNVEEVKEGHQANHAMQNLSRKGYIERIPESDGRRTANYKVKQEGTEGNDTSD